jgi:F-type H+-transporting ATPase subunit b
LQKWIPHSLNGSVVTVAFACLALGPGAARATEGGLELMPDPTMLALLLALFVALIFPVDRLLFRPIFRVLDQRAERISGTRRRAEELAAEARDLLARYDQTVSGAREDAERERRGRLDEARSAHVATTGEARSEAEQQIAAARAEVGAALESARAQIRSQCEGLARQAAERVLGRSLS